MSNLPVSFCCSRCRSEFSAHRYSLFLVDRTVPAYCGPCRAEESEKFVSMIVHRLDAISAEKAEA